MSFHFSALPVKQSTLFLFSKYTRLCPDTYQETELQSGTVRYLWWAGAQLCAGSTLFTLSFFDKKTQGKVNGFPVRRACRQNKL
ncbi:hypothetical protein SRHO_G00315930 [Serrasalmus rhombeus]